MSQQHHIDDVADDEVINAARTLGAMRNVGTSPKESAFDGTDLGARYDTGVRGHALETGNIVEILILQVSSWSAHFSHSINDYAVLINRSLVFDYIRYFDVPARRRWGIYVKGLEHAIPRHRIPCL